MRVAAGRRADRPRVARDERKRAQSDLDLPPYPTTTTGSLPQTTEVRQLRVRLGKGELDARRLRRRDGAPHHRLGRLAGADGPRRARPRRVRADRHGRVLRRDRWTASTPRATAGCSPTAADASAPPILAAPPTIREPMTVDEWRIAQDATDKPVKGMLTGPVTIVNWSFRPPGVPDDRLFWAVAQPIAEEVGNLVAAGARVIQVDEPAVRERWPLPTEDAPRLREIYARGVRAALNHVFNQPAARPDAHAHVLRRLRRHRSAVVRRGRRRRVDRVQPLEGRQLHPPVLRALRRRPSPDRPRRLRRPFAAYPGRIGHERAAPSLPRRSWTTADLWVNPDCGLKTRGWEEIERQLGDMVAAPRPASEAGDGSPSRRAPRWPDGSRQADELGRDGRGQPAAPAEHDPPGAARPMAARPHHRQPVQAGARLALRVRRADHPRRAGCAADRRLLDPGPEHPGHRVGGARRHRQRRRTRSSSSRATCFPRSSTGATATRSSSTCASSRHRSRRSQFEVGMSTRSRRWVFRRRVEVGGQFFTTGPVMDPASRCPRSAHASSCGPTIRRSTSRSRRR